MNASRLAILTLVLGLAVGFGIGFLQGGASGSVIEAAGPSGPEPGGPTPIVPNTTERSPSQLDAVSDSVLTKSTGLAASAPAVSAEAKRLAGRVTADAAVKLNDPSSWTGVIRGTVLNELGEPLVGATVLSMNSYTNYRTQLNANSTTGFGRAYSGPSDLEESVARSAEAQLKSRRNTRTATVDAKGEFELSGLKDGMQRLRVYAEGYTFTNLEYEVGTSVEIVGEQVAVFTLDVRLPDGSVPDEATVAISEERSSTQHYKWTAAEPELRLATRNIEFRVFSGHVRRLEWRETVGDFSSKDQSLNLDRDGVGPHVVQLDASQLCQVNVNDTSGLVPIIRPWVKIVRSDVHTAGDFDWSSDKAIKLTREEGGRYATKDLPEGSYVVGVGRGGDEPEVTEPLQVLAGLTTLEVPLGDLDLSRFLVVNCTGPNHLPANGVRFTSTAEGKEGGTSSGGVDALKRGRGEYWLAADGLLHGSSWSDYKSAHLVATSKDYGTIETAVDEGMKDLQLAFSMPCELVVLVSGDHSAGYRATITEYKEDNEDSMQRRYSGFTSGRNSKKLDGDGRALFTGKQPGQYEVSLTKSGHGDNGYSSWDKPNACKEIVTLREGTNEVTLTLPTFHTVTVYAPGQRKGTNFQLRPEGSNENDYFSGTRAELGDDERATFEDVPAGNYTLMSWNSMGSTMTITVPCGEVTFEVKETNCLKVSGVEAGKAGAEAGLQDGDLITHIDGAPLKGQMAMQVATMKILSSKITLTVRRGNTDLSIEMGPLGASAEAMSNLGFRARPHTID